MDVRRTFVDRVDQHLLDETHDWCIVDLGSGVFVLLIGRSLLAQQIHVEVFARQIPQGIRCRLADDMDQFHQLGQLDHHRIDRKPCLEPDFVERADIRRVGHRHG